MENVHLIFMLTYKHTFFIKCGSSHTESISSLDSFGATSKVRVVGATKMSECVTTEQSGTGMGLVPREATIITGPETQFFLIKREIAKYEYTDTYAKIQIHSI